MSLLQGRIVFVCKVTVLVLESQTQIYKLCFQQLQFEERV